MEKKQTEERQIEKKAAKKEQVGEKQTAKKADGEKAAAKKSSVQKTAVKKPGKAKSSQKVSEKMQMDEKPKKKKRLSRKKRRALRRKRLRMAGVAALVCLMLLAAVFFMKNVIIGGAIYPLSAERIDLRGQGLSSTNVVSRMTQLNQALLSDNNLTDVSPLCALTSCEYIDLTGNPVTDESYALLKQALPNCLILCEAQDTTTTELVLGGYPLPDENALVSVFESHKALKTVDLRGTDLPQQTGTALSLRFPHITFIYSSDDAANELIITLDDSADAAQALQRAADSVRVTVTGCVFTPQEYRALAAQFAAMKIDCLIDLYGNTLAIDEEQIDLSRSWTDAALEEDLRLFSELKSLTLGETMPSEAARLKSALGLQTLYYSYNGCLIAPETTQIDIKGASGLNAAEFEQLLSDLPQLEKVFMDTPDEEMLVSVHEYKDRVHFVYDIRAFRHDFSTGATSIDLEGQVKDADVEELMELIDLMHDLEQVDMYESTLSFENMDLLFDTYPDIFFGWTFKICDRRYTIRTDITAFSTQLGQPRNLWDEDDFKPLRYCKNLQALDLGHNGIWSLDFLYELPKLKVLILADNNISDITPLASLTGLEYLELFMNYRVVDYSPLSDLENLLDLNIRCENLEPHSIDIEDFMPIKSLERLWISSGHLTDEEEQRLRDALPDCNISITSKHSTSNGWRTHKRHEVVKEMFDTRVYVPFE